MAIIHLQGARRNRNDEFYTQMSDIEKELDHYREHLKDKVIFCNCDNPKRSNFWKYFYQNFHTLGLKGLIATYLKEGKPSYKSEYDGSILTKEQLKGNGDFRTPEIIELLKRSDIVITNPPFSLFIEYIHQLEEFKKDFILIGNTNAITYKEIFELFRQDKIRIGHTNFNVGMFFEVPDYFEQYTLIKDGVKYARVSTACWFTNLKTPKDSKRLVLKKKYAPEEFPEYENYKAIEVGKVENIPEDFDGIMGVPITFMNKFEPEQFEIVGADFEIKDRLSYLQKPHWTGSFHRGVIDGKTKYARILIQRKKMSSF